MCVLCGVLATSASLRPVCLMLQLSIQGPLVALVILQQEASCLFAMHAASNASSLSWLIQASQDHPITLCA